jgi:hypothetical protein
MKNLSDPDPRCKNTVGSGVKTFRIRNIAKRATRYLGLSSAAEGAGTSTAGRRCCRDSSRLLFTIILPLSRLGGAGGGGGACDREELTAADWPACTNTQFILIFNILYC